MTLFDYENEHLDILHKRIAECTVLLKKDGSFPLGAPCRIAAFGSGVRHTVKGGTGSGEVNSRFYVSIEQGLEDEGFEIASKGWLDAYDKVREEAQIRFIKDIKAQARKMHKMAMIFAMGAAMPEPEYDLSLDCEADAAIYVLSRNSGEGNDRKDIPGDFELTGTEIRDILALNTAYDRFMLVLNTGGPVDLSPVLASEDHEGVRNILLLSQLGVLTGTALADILLGRASPSGKLSTTWGRISDYCPDMDFGGQDDTFYNEGIYVGYRYFDSAGIKAAFPFGYGLSYADFEPGKAEVMLPVHPCEEGDMEKNDTVTVTLPVANIGDHPGAEVVQVYVSAPGGRLDKPYQDLAAFARTGCLEPGEKQDVSLSFRMSDLASYDTENAAYILEKGDYVIRVGNSSTDTVPAAVVRLRENVTVRKVRPIAGDPGFTDRTYFHDEEETLPDDIPVLELSADAFVSSEAVYDLEEEILPEVHEMPMEDLIYMGVGRYSSRLGITDVIGHAGRSVAGAAGETTNVLADRGIGTLVMADGPAGLRLSPVFYRDKNGPHPVGGSALPFGMEQFMPGALKLIAGLFKGSQDTVPEGIQPEYQYCTAIPIGTAIAQSWDREMAEEFGSIVGDEMVRMGIHLWLAPAMNIHRSVLCGRNFEYYSEDPLLSGSMAAAVTRGVQSHSGCGVTIKHYTANNQETNRSFNNSHISERALREIYLKGFAIAVRESAPCAVMTSYNLLNGVHTSESRGLIMDYLRAEHGFDGIVMTDWVVAAANIGTKSKYRNAQASYVAAAGGDIFMPGSQSDFNNISRAVSEGGLSRKQLEINATRMLKMIRRLRGRA